MAQIHLQPLSMEYSQNSMKNNKVFSVSQINRYLKGLVDDDGLLRQVSICGEVSNLTYHSTGHIYFSLKENTFRIKGVMFRGQRTSGLKFSMKDGDQVIVTGDVTVFERSGECQIIATAIQLDGEGDLAAKFEKLKRELAAMGMFDAMYKKPIPTYAKRIGVVTSPTGAAIHDIITVAKRRNPYVEIILYPAIVQGESTAQSVICGIEVLDAMGLDVLLVGRGGGSMEDLWGFNDEQLARAIFECKTPVISCVGHDVDVTIADFVADVRAATPSEAAEKAVFVYADFEERLRGYESRLSRAMGEQILDKRTQLVAFLQRIRLLRPEHKLAEQRQYTMMLEERLRTLMERKLESYKHEMSILAGRLDALSPAKSLSQGYGYVTTIEGKRVTSAANVDTGDELNIYVSDGEIHTVVLESIMKEK